MSEKTIFKKIIDKEIPADIVYESDSVLAFLDINPVTKGHTLLIPKEPIVYMQDMEDNLLSDIFVKAKELMIVLKKATECDYVQLVVEGIAVPHFHIHLIPSSFKQENAVWSHVVYQEGEQKVYVEKIKNCIN